MTLDEFYNLSRDECFERIKDESRSQAKQRLYFGAIVSLLIIVILIILVIGLDRVRIFPSCQLAVFCVAAGWQAVNNYRFLKLVDNLGTPKHLLYWYEKTISNNRNAYYLGMLGLIGNIVDPYACARHEWDWVWVDIVFVVGMLVFLIYSYFKGDYLKYKTNRDEEIIDRLEDLIKKE